AEGLGDAVDRGVVSAQGLGRLVGPAAVEQVQDDQVADAEAGMAAAPQVPEQLLLDGEADGRQDGRHGDSLLGARGPQSLLPWESPFSSPLRNSSSSPLQL